QRRQHHFHFKQRKRHSDATTVRAAEGKPRKRIRVVEQKALQLESVGLGIEIRPSMNQVRRRRKDGTSWKCCFADSKVRRQLSCDPWTENVQPQRFCYGRIQQFQISKIVLCRPLSSGSRK